MGNGNEEIEMKKWGIFKQKHQVEVVFLLVYIYIYINFFRAVHELCNLLHRPLLAVK